MGEQTTDYWQHDWSPFLFQFPDNPLGLEGIRYYGLAYLISFFFAGYFLFLCQKKNKLSLPAKERSDLLTYLILGVLIGGRAGYLILYDFADFIAMPWVFFRIDQGGMASHGGILGACLATFFFARRRRLSSLQIGDALVAFAPLGILIGRFANFINGELWGKITTLPWAILFPNSPMLYSDLTGYYGIQPRHPSQLYALFSEGLIPLMYLQYRFWYTRYSTGQLVGEFLVLYSSLRIANELFREPDASLILGLSRGQAYSIILLLIGVLYLSMRKRSI